MVRWKAVSKLREGLGVHFYLVNENGREFVVLSDEESKSADPEWETNSRRHPQNDLETGKYRVLRIPPKTERDGNPDAPGE